MSDGQAANVGSALEMALSCVLEGSHRSIADQSLFSEFHAMQVNQWNQHQLEPLNMTFQEAISTQVRLQPNARGELRPSFRRAASLGDVTRNEEAPLLFSAPGIYNCEDANLIISC